VSEWVCSSCGKDLPVQAGSGTVASACPSCGGKLVRIEKANVSGPSQPADGAEEYDVTRKLAATGATKSSSRKAASPGDPESPTKTSDLDRPREARPWDQDAKPQGEAPAGAADAEADPLVGRVLGGCEIICVVGRGAMGTVYEAKQLSLDRTVAVKTIRRDYVTDKQFLQRFRQEARTVGRFNTPHVVQIHEVGFDQGYHYLVMELVRGGNLRSYVASQPGRALSTMDALEFLSQSSEGLLQAEKLKIIHRDIKPGNLLVDRQNRVKITDFGIAKMLESDTQITMTGTNDVIGTPLYMSPEQVEGGPIDHRSDMYSLGATFFHLLTGAPPVEGESFYEVIKRKSLLPSLSPRRMKDSKVPEDVSAIIEKMTALRPGDRYPSFQNLIDDLAKVRQGKKVEPPLTRPAKPSAPLRGKKKTLVSAALVVALVAIVGYSFLPWRSAPGSNGALVDAKDDGKTNGTQQPAGAGSASKADGSGQGERAGQTPVVGVGVVTPGRSGGESSVMPSKVSPNTGGDKATTTGPDAQLASKLADLKTRFTKEGPVKTVLDDATAFRVQVNEISQPELQAEAKSFLDDIDECRRIEAAVLSKPVEAVEIVPPFRAVAQHWNAVNPVLQPTAKAGPELRFWLESERTRRIDSLEKRIVPALQTALADAEKARQSYLAWEAPPEAYRDALDRVVEGRTKLMELFPEKKDVWEAAVKPEAITALEDVASRRAAEGRMAELDKSSATLLAEVEAVKGAAQWKPEMAARVEKESAALGSALKDMQTTYPRAPMAALLARAKQIEERRAVWAAHMRAMEEAVLSIQPGKLDEAALKIDALKATGVPDPAADRLLAGRQAILDGFQVLFTRLDSINAAAQFSSAEEKLRDFPDAARYAADLKARTDLFREKSSNMALVPAGEVDPPDRKPVARVDAFFIDRTEVSVREFEQFAAAMAKSQYEAVSRLWPSANLFTKYRSSPEYLRSGNIDPTWPIEDVNYHQARAYALWREKDIPTFEEWWLAARGPFRGGTHRANSPNPRESKSPDRPVRVDLGGVAVAFPPTYRVHHLSGNVAEWCRVDRTDAGNAPLVGGRYADSSEKKFLGEAPDYSPLEDSRRGYGFRCILRPVDFFAGLLPSAKKPGG